MIQLLRIKHWIKNSFVFLPAFFAGKLFNENTIFILGLTFLIFSFMASAIYVINDYKDIKLDKLHPTKKNRPLASGRVLNANAKIVCALLFFLAISGAYSVHLNLFLIIIAYFVLNIIYTFSFKKIAIIDIVCISIGFVLRIFAGAVSTGIQISEWLVLMVFLISLLMGFAKRRDDLLIKEERGVSVRKSIDGYNKEFVDLSIVFMAGIVVVCYIMYSTNSEVVSRIGSQYLYMTSIFVIVGILRYLQITFVFEKSGSPTDILWRDKFLQIVIFLWISVFGMFLYT